MTDTLISTLYSNPWKTVRGVINSNMTIASGIFPTMPQNEVIYPIYVMEGVDTQTSGKTFGDVNLSKDVNVQLMGVASSKQQLDEICDEAEKILWQQRSVTRDSGLKLMNINSSNTEPIELNGKIVHGRLINANYKWWGSI